ncbi:RNA polymerase I enhancer binding protein [Orbilia oligospora]|uniref:RNA polymerase I enhancer binding protein n=1 Tax=Orbilia oligospora TaxID=2813651 RepID=A0A7C8N5B0_ORBOL|nr:RNA polymerase I enhancer binding protein [Orbilia oligospora]KAF3089222.1 RNA polymerase I enhancer binding protein [Orbilia oligospora]KAF3101486.1 RNA polymerase I enhancer binding protein [Orbilia oligospora]KAF3127752.1 RNA polymerase I enhancer binding protein [Orbilia oligospora]KAF3148613.1 RNA polymerase I enhancer binding protein [Orbilia oligospora]
MLRSFWSFVASTPQKSSQSQQNFEADLEGSPTPGTTQSEQQLEMPGTPVHQSSPAGHDGNDDKVAHSPNSKRKRHKKKVKSSPVSIVEVPATAEQLEEERLEEDEREEDGAMADVSNAEASAKRKRRKSDLELSEKKAKRSRKHKKSAGEGTWTAINESLPTEEAGDDDEAADIEGEEAGVEGDDDDDEHPRIPGVRWFGDVAGVFFEGKWVEADISQVAAIKKRMKAQKARRMEKARQMENEPEPELEGQEPEAIEETDRDDKDDEGGRKNQREHNKKSKNHEPAPELEVESHEPAPEPGPEAEPEPQPEPEPEPEPAEAKEASGKDTSKKQKSKRRKGRKQPEPEAGADSEPEPATKERRRSKNTKDTSEESSRRRTYPQAAEGVNPPQVIIPSATDRSFGNSKGVGPPPRPAAYDRGPFTPTEDALIQNVINRYCQLQVPRLNRAGFLNIIWNNDRHKTDFWNVLMTNLPLRTRQSLHAHVRRMYNDFEDRGKWTKEQDDELRDLVAQKGTKWIVIGGLLDRMPEDCRDRWKNYVVCGENRRTNFWDEQEIEKMLEILDDMLETLVAGHEENGTLALPVPEGESEEGRAARLENEKFCHREEIDWMIVSERMGHTRSRMQCLAKGKDLWAKIDDGLDVGSRRTKKSRAKKGRKGKRAVEDGGNAEEIPLPALKEAKNMLPGDYLYVLQRISVQGYDCLASIDWNKLAEIDTVKHFTPEQFKAGFHSYMKDHNPPKKDLRSFVAEQLGDLSELPGMIRNKRYRPPAGATSPAVAAAPPTAKKNRRQKKQDAAQIQQPGSPAEAEARSNNSSHHGSPPRRLNRTEKPSHSPGNPFAKQPSNGKEAASPSGPRTRGKAASARASKKLPKKQYKSAEYISDSDNDKNDDNEAAEEDAQGGEVMEVDGANGVSGSAEAEEPENGAEADDEMGESVAFGNASKEKKRS